MDPFRVALAVKSTTNDVHHRPRDCSQRSAISKPAQGREAASDAKIYSSHRRRVIPCEGVRLVLC